MTGFAGSSSATHRSFQRDQICSSGINHRRTCSFKLFELSAKSVGVGRNLRLGVRSFDGALDQRNARVVARDLHLRVARI